MANNRTKWVEASRCCDCGKAWPEIRIESVCRYCGGHIDVLCRMQLEWQPATIELLKPWTWFDRGRWVALPDTVESTWRKLHEGCLPSRAYGESPAESARRDIIALLAKHKEAGDVST